MLTKRGTKTHLFRHLNRWKVPPGRCSASAATRDVDAIMAQWTARGYEVQNEDEIACRGKAMNDFKKAKITFALALLGTLFALHRVVENPDYQIATTFTTYLGYQINIVHAYL